MRNAFYYFLAWLGIGAIALGAVTFVVNNLKAFPDSSYADIPPVMSGCIVLAGIVLVAISFYARMRK